MKYQFLAKKNTGEEKKGELEAKDRFDLAKKLKEEGFVLIFAKEVKDKKNALDFDLSFLTGVSTAEKMIFCRNLSVMVNAGISAPRALEVLSRQTKSKVFKNSLLSIAENVQKGNSLSDSMAKYPKIFNSIFVAMVKVGEESGKLGDSLKVVAEQLERDHALIKKVQGALIYPSIIMIAMIGIGIILMIYVVPTLVATFKELGTELPSSTKFIIAISDFMAGSTITFLISLALFVSASIYAVKSKVGQIILDTVFLRVPVLSTLIKKLNSARTSRTMASLISSGVNMVETLAITQEVLQNHHYKNVLNQAKEDVQKGIPISVSFKNAERLYPSLVGEMIAVGEETGKLSDMLFRLSDFYEEEVSATTKDLSTIIEPVLMLIIGAAVGFFAISMIRPMYSMMNNI